jgi:hypothetical protein
MTLFDQTGIFLFLEERPLSYLEDQEHAEFLKNWKEVLAATNADELKHL